MKIAFDHQIFTRQQFGGISRYFIQLGEELIHLQQDVKAFTPFHGNSYLHTSPLPSQGVYCGSSFYSFKGPFIYLNDFLCRLQTEIWKPNIIHETYFAPFRTGPSGIPVVITVHDMTHERFPDYFSKNDPSQSLKKKAVKRADHIICISENTRLDLIELSGVPEHKITVIHHGFVPLTLGETPIPSNEIHDTPYLLYVGSREGYKNFNSLLVCFAASKQLVRDFHLIAFGAKPFTTNEKELIQQLGLSGKVHHITGNDERLTNFYKHATAFIYPSLYEGFGFPPLESMACDCPVAASNGGSIPEIVGNAALLFNPEDKDDFTQTILKVAYDETIRKKLIENGRIRRNFFSWETCAKKTLQVYQSLCESTK